MSNEFCPVWAGQKLIWVLRYKYKFLRIKIREGVTKRKLQAEITEQFLQHSA